MEEWLTLKEIEERALYERLPPADWGLQGMVRAIFRGEFQEGEIGWAVAEYRALGVDGDEQYWNLPEPPLDPSSRDLAPTWIDPASEAYEKQVEANALRIERLTRVLAEYEPSSRPEEPSFEVFGDPRRGALEHLLLIGTARRDDAPTGGVIDRLRLTDINVDVVFENHGDEGSGAADRPAVSADHAGCDSSLDRAYAVLAHVTISECSAEEEQALYLLACRATGLLRWCKDNSKTTPTFLTDWIDTDPETRSRSPRNSRPQSIERDRHAFELVTRAKNTLGTSKCIDACRYVARHHSDTWPSVAAVKRSYYRHRDRERGCVLWSGVGAVGKWPAAATAMSQAAAGHLSTAVVIAFPR